MGRSNWNGSYPLLLRERDSNPRPLGYEPSGLPTALPRYFLDFPGKSYQGSAGLFRKLLISLLSTFAPMRVQRVLSRKTLATTHATEHRGLLWGQTTTRTLDLFQCLKGINSQAEAQGPKFVPLIASGPGQV